MIIYKLFQEHILKVNLFKNESTLPNQYTSNIIFILFKGGKEVFYIYLRNSKQRLSFFRHKLEKCSL